MAQDAGSLAEMLQGAEDALALAKKHVGSDFVRFHSDIRQYEQRRNNQHMSDELIAALNERRIVLAYQPIACSRSRTIKYHEGLVRLVGRDGRVKGAGEIISQAEQTGLLKHIDMRVIELAIAELVRDPEAALSINVDGVSVVESDWAGDACCIPDRPPGRSRAADDRDYGNGPDPRSRRNLRRRAPHA